MSQVWDHNCSSHTQKLVLLALADNANDEGSCWPSIATISQKCQLSERCVYEQVGRLVKSHLLSIKSGGGNRSNVYQLHLRKHTPERHAGVNAMQGTPEQDAPLPLNTVQGTPERHAGEPSDNHQLTTNEPKRLLPCTEMKSRLNALYKRETASRWGNDEEHYLVEVARREHVLAELSEVEAFFKSGTYLPQKLTTLLAGWTGVLDRARNPSRSNSLGASNGRPATISDLRTVIQFKAEKAKAIKERFSTEGPVSTDWSNNEKKQEYFVLRKEINELKAKAERMVQ